MACMRDVKNDAPSSKMRFAKVSSLFYLKLNSLSSDAVNCSCPVYGNCLQTFPNLRRHGHQTDYRDVSLNNSHIVLELCSMSSALGHIVSTYIDACKLDQIWCDRGATVPAMECWRFNFVYLNLSYPFIADG